MTQWRRVVDTLVEVVVSTLVVSTLSFSCYCCCCSVAFHQSIRICSLFLTVLYHQRWAKGLIDRSSDTNLIFLLYLRIQLVDVKFRFLFWLIVSVRFKFRFFNRPILFLDLKFRLLYLAIVSVRFKFRLSNQPVLFLGFKFRFLYCAIVLGSFK